VNILLKSKGVINLKIGIKATSGVISGILLLGSISIPVSNVFASESVQNNVQEEQLPFTNQEIQSTENYFNNFDEQEFYNAFAKAVNENKSEFIDPSVAQQLLNNVQQQINPRPQTRGKVTLTAKAGAKAIKAVMDKVGQKAWDKMMHTVETSTGTTLVTLHWQSITKFLDYAVGFNGEIEEALESFLVKKCGFNSTVAYWVAKGFVAIVL